MKSSNLLMSNSSLDAFGHLSDNITAPMKVLYALSSLLFLNMVLSIVGKSLRETENV